MALLLPSQPVSRPARSSKETVELLEMSARADSDVSDRTGFPWRLTLLMSSPSHPVAARTTRRDIYSGHDMPRNEKFAVVSAHVRVDALQTLAHMCAHARAIAVLAIVRSE